MSFFSRIFKVAQSEAHAAVDKLEDPIKMTEQGIRDLRQTLEDALHSLAQVKATTNRLKHDMESHQAQADDYQRKALALLQKAQAGDLDDAEADRLASSALAEKNQATQAASRLAEDYHAQRQAEEALQAKVETLRRNIQRYQNELITLKARAKTAASMKKVNKELAGADASATIHMLEKMKARVLEEETLAQAYGEIGATGAGGANVTVQQEIDKALTSGNTPTAAINQDLAALKAQLNAENPKE